MKRQYVAIKFKPGDSRTYTYHNDGDPVKPGDKVVVTTNRGKNTVIVDSVTDEAPRFLTKPIAIPVDAKAGLIDDDKPEAKG